MSYQMNGFTLQHTFTIGCFKQPWKLFQRLSFTTANHDDRNAPSMMIVFHLVHCKVFSSKRLKKALGTCVRNMFYLCIFNSVKYIVMGTEKNKVLQQEDLSVSEPFFVQFV